MVLMAVADANYCFVYVDIGAYGRNHDGGIFNRSTFGRSLADVARNPLRLPGLRKLPDSNIVCPHVFVGDSAFAIGPNFMTAYGGNNRRVAQRTFDARMNRARVVVENTFGIMCTRFRILRQPIIGLPGNVEKLIQAIVVLHNFLRKTDSQLDVQRRYIRPGMLDYEDETGRNRDGSWRNELPPDAALQQMARCRSRSALGQYVRSRFTEYFQTEAGQLQWQRRRLFDDDQFNQSSSDDDWDDDDCP